MGYKTKSNKQIKQTEKLIDTDNRIMVTRGGVDGENKDGNGGQIYGEGKRLALG